MILSDLTKKQADKLIGILKSIGVDVRENYQTQDYVNCIHSKWSYAFYVKEGKLDPILQNYLKKVSQHRVNHTLVNTLFNSVPYIFKDGPYFVYCYDYWMLD